MVDAIFPLVILPIIIISIMLFAFSTQVSSLQDTKNRVFCKYPDFNTGINNVTVGGCSIINHPTSYSLDKYVIYNLTVPSCVFFSCGSNGTVFWAPSIPNGWLTFAGDTFTSVGHRVFKVGEAFVAIVTIPTQISGLSWFAIPEAVLVVWIILGAVIIVRGG